MRLVLAGKGSMAVIDCGVMVLVALFPTHQAVVPVMDATIKTAFPTCFISLLGLGAGPYFVGRR